MARQNLGLLLMALAIVSPINAQSQEAHILAPARGAAVAWRTCVVAEISDASAEAYFVVRDLATGNVYVQPRPSVLTTTEPAEVRSMVYFADDDPRYEGSVFEVAVVLNPVRPLVEGEVLPNYPEARARSPIVDVVRRRGAVSGCESDGSVALSDLVAAPVTPGDDAAVFGHAAAARTPQVPAVGVERTRTNESMPERPLRLWATLALVFLGLVIAPDSRRVSHERMRDLVDIFWVRLGTIAGAVTVRTRAMIGSVNRWQHGTTSSAWRACGQGTSWRAWIVEAAMVSVLLPGAYFAFLAEAAATLQGISIVFESVGTSVDGPIGSLFSHSGEAPEGVASAAGGPRLPVIIVAPLRALWSAPLGPMALGIAAGVTVLGLVLLSGSPKGAVVAAKFSGLWRERRLATQCYATLVLGIAVLAAFRGYELSSMDIVPAVPSAVAFLIAAAMPWVLTAAVHLLIESVAETAAPIAAGLTAGLVACVGVIAIAACAVAAGALLMVPAALFLLLALASFAMRSVLWLAELVAEGARSLLRGAARVRTLWLERGHGTLARTRLAAMAVLLIALLGRSEPLEAEEFVPRHDPSKPHTAWAFCLDTSTSVLPSQFEKGKQILRAFVSREVGPNALVWFVKIDADPVEAHLVSLPYRSARRSDGALTEERLATARREAVEAVAQTRQEATRSRVHECIALALRLLTSAGKAEPRTLVVVSDFVQDAVGRVTLSPPTRLDSGTAGGVRVLLLVAQPEERYLAPLGVSREGLVGSIHAEWRPYVLALGATEVVVRPVDSLPAE